MGIVLIFFVVVNTYLVEGFDAQRSTQNFTVEYVLFTRSNSIEGHTVSLSNEQGLQELFRHQNPTRFISHGWRGDQTSESCSLIRQKYLTRGDYNIFVIDWGISARNLNYIQVAFDSLEAGKQVASFLDRLNEEYDLDFNNTYMIGYSLGAHVVGLAAKLATRGKVNTIFGLDPAGPLFTAADPSIRLTAKDALYVETIHTNAGFNGFSEPIGIASFFPNGGTHQPGCSDFFGSCSHKKSYQYFADSLDINYNFFAVQCSELIFKISQKCKSTGNVARMGGEPSNFGRGVEGVYYLTIK